MIRHNLIPYTVKELIDLRGQIMATKKFQPILSEGCDNTISQVNAELSLRGIKPIRK